MPSPLRVLLADADKARLRTLGDAFQRRHCRVETCAEGTEALDLVRERRSQGRSYDVLVAALRLPGLDGLSLLQKMRQVDHGVTCCLVHPYHELDAQTKDAADRSGCHLILDVPIDQQQVDRLVEDVNRGDRTPVGSAPDETPFFGTARVGGIDPSPSRGHDRPPVEPSGDTPVPSTATRTGGGSAVEQMRPSATPSRPSAGGPGTGSHAPPSAVIYRHRSAEIVDPEEARRPGTSRIRRSVTDSLRRGERRQTARLTRTAIQRVEVRCAHCQDTFIAVRKKESYAIPCVKCGQWNTIDPV